MTTASSAFRLLAAAAVLALPLSGVGGELSAQRPKAQAQRDWTRTIAMTPDGGYRMGNPAAPVKVVEYLSLTCGRCAEFSAQGAPQLKERYVRTGRVSIEYRNYVLNGLDLAAAVLSRCAAPGRYFALTEQLLANQAEWVGRYQAISAADRQALTSLPPGQVLARIATLSGIDRIAAAHGVTPAAAQACFASAPRLQRLEGMRRAADQLGVSGTPSFTINGRPAGHAHNWAELEPLLRPPAG
jgi:protein-disulfide isomerase